MTDHRFPVPSTIPGQLIEDPEHLYFLKEHLQNLVGTRENRFPGSQPVSFTHRSIPLLESLDFWVCEKSDGVRVLVLILGTEAGPEVYLVDRKYNFYLNLDFPFPHHMDPSTLHTNTILDAELVIDVDPQTGAQTLKLLCFDLLVLDGENLMQKPLSSRYGRLGAWVYAPLEKLLRENPAIQEQLPFQVKLKQMEKAYGVEAVFRDHLPRLEHGNDGLIFTCAVGPYVIGTDENILKWKPPNENSIDFRLELRFPPCEDDPSKPDYHVKPLFLLMMNCGREPEQVFDLMDVSDEQWEDIVQSGEQYDNRVVEVVWDPELQTWKMLRFRDDKGEGNYRDVVMKILTSIKDGVNVETLIKNAGRIKQGWRTREAEARAKAEAKAKSEAEAHARAIKAQAAFAQSNRPAALKR